MSVVKPCYVVRLSTWQIAIADLVRPGELYRFWTITRINVPPQHRGFGHGSDLLKQILCDADLEQVKLALEPYPSGPLDYDELVSWYRRYGFIMTRSGYMVRRPKA